LIDLVRAGRQSSQFVIAQRRDSGVDFLRAYPCRFQGFPRLVRRKEALNFLQILLARLAGVYQFFVDVSLGYDV
jgi:hypothetical protein